MTLRRPRRLPEQVIRREQLARLIASELRARRLSQNEAAVLTGEAQSQLSLIVHGRLRGFSVERLLRVLTRFGYDVEFRVRPAARSVGRVRVVAKRGAKTPRRPNIKAL